MLAQVLPEPWKQELWTAGVNKKIPRCLDNVVLFVLAALYYRNVSENNFFLSLFLQEQNRTVRVMFAALEQHESCSACFWFRSFTSYLLSLCPHRTGRIFGFNYLFFAADWNVSGICIGIVFPRLTLISFSLIWRLKAADCGLCRASLSEQTWSYSERENVCSCLNAAQRPFNLARAQFNVCSTAGSGSPALAVCLSQAEAGLDRETVSLTGPVTSGLLIAWCRRWSFSHQTADGWYLVPEPSCIFYCIR